MVLASLYMHVMTAKTHLLLPSGASVLKEDKDASKINRKSEGAKRKMNLQIPPLLNQMLVVEVIRMLQCFWILILNSLLIYWDHYGPCLAGSAEWFNCLPVTYWIVKCTLNDTVNEAALVPNSISSSVNWEPGPLILSTTLFRNVTVSSVQDICGGEEMTSHLRN